MRAEPKLIDLIERTSVTKEMVARLPKEDIILRDQDKKEVEYEDTPQIVAWRENVRRINEVLSEAELFLDLTESEREACREDLGYVPNPFNNTLYRVFNGSFENGGSLMAIGFRASLRNTGNASELIMNRRRSWTTLGSTSTCSIV